MNAPVSFAESKMPLLLAVLFVIGLIAAFAVYPTFLMKILCYALFACAFNLLLGFAGHTKYTFCNYKDTPAALFFYEPGCTLHLFFKIFHIIMLFQNWKQKLAAR